MSTNIVLPCVLYVQKLMAFITYPTIEIGCLDQIIPEAISPVAKACQVAKKSVWASFAQGASTAVSCSH